MLGVPPFKYESIGLPAAICGRKVALCLYTDKVKGIEKQCVTGTGQCWGVCGQGVPV